LARSEKLKKPLAIDGGGLFVFNGFGVDRYFCPNIAEDNNLAYFLTTLRFLVPQERQVLLGIAQYGK
jgi:hypothetical protein